MINLISILFWLCLFLVFYTYLGYGLVVWIWVKIRQKLGRNQPSEYDLGYLPEVTVVIAAYNEIECIAAKLQNCFSLYYPSERLKFLFVTEGSTDGTTAYLESQQSSQIKVLGGSLRSGKVEAINRAMQHVDSEIVVFTDANTQLNKDALQKIVRHFKDDRVGAVAGEKRVKDLSQTSTAGIGEGLYWKYESFLKKLDTALYSVVGAAGELFAIRRGLYQPVEKDTLLDDFIISLRIAAEGYKVVYEPDAYAIEQPSFSVEEEQKRKVRIAAGGFQAISRLRSLLNVFKYPILTFQYVSHRAMRWAVAPFCLILILLFNIPLSFTSSFYNLTLWLQIIFYAIAIAGYVLERQKIHFKLLYVPFYFTFMNVCAVLGFLRFQQGISTGIWEKAKRG